MNNPITALVDDAKAQWLLLVKIQTELMTLRTVQLIVMANLRDLEPLLHSKIVDNLDEYLKLCEEGDANMKSPEVTSHIRQLRDIELEQLSVMQEQLRKILKSELPPSGDLFQ